MIVCRHFGFLDQARCWPGIVFKLGDSGSATHAIEEARRLLGSRRDLPKRRDRFAEDIGQRHGRFAGPGVDQCRWHVVQEACLRQTMRVLSQDLGLPTRAGRFVKVVRQVAHFCHGNEEERFGVTGIRDLDPALRSIFEHVGKRVGQRCQFFLADVAKGCFRVVDVVRAEQQYLPVIRMGEGDLKLDDSVIRKLLWQDRKASPRRG